MGTAKRIVTSATGFPYNTKTLEHLQEGFSEPIKQLARLVGEYTILTGVEKSDTNVSHGFVVVNGNIYPVLGGLTSLENPKFAFVQQTDNAMYDVTGSGIGSELLPAYITEYFQLVESGDFAFLLSDLTRLKTIKQQQAAIPEKFIVPLASGTINFQYSEGSYQQKNIPIPNFGISNYHVSLTVRNTDSEATVIDKVALANVNAIVTHKGTSQVGIFIDSKGANQNFAVDWELTYWHSNE